MGSKYKERFEREFDGCGTHDIKRKTLKLIRNRDIKKNQTQADRNISGLTKGKFKRRRLK